MAADETKTAKEKLIDFIYNLTHEECEIIVSFLTNNEERAAG